MIKRCCKGRATVHVFATAIALLAPAAGADYSSHPDTQKFVDEMATEHAFDRGELQTLFAEVNKQESILEAIARPAEKVLSWKEYRNIFLGDARIDGGVAFWRDNADTLARAEREFGVPPAIIVAVLGVETRYGHHAGDYRVIDALATLGFDYPPRSRFFRSELKHFLLLAREQKQDPLSLKGSYAGAMGYGQFMPSSYRAYAVDFNGDVFVDIWNSPVDAIGSVANYFQRHGWERDRDIAVRARLESGADKSVFSDKLTLSRTVAELRKHRIMPVAELTDDELADDEKVMPFKLEGVHGAEFWLGLQNFYVITRYNRSQLYAMAVMRLAEAIERRYRQAQQINDSESQPNVEGVNDLTALEGGAGRVDS